MKLIGTPPRPPGEWDVPATQVAAEFVALKAKRTAEAQAAEQRHVLDPADGAFARLACTHPDACSCDSGDPVWDAWLADRIAASDAAWTAAHTKQPGRAT